MHSVGMSFCSRGCGRGMVHIAKQSQASSPDSVLSCLATTYLPSPSRDKYSRRWRSSRPCSGWVRVFPLRYGHQTSPLRWFLAHTASAFGLQMCSLGPNFASDGVSCNRCAVFVCPGTHVALAFACRCACSDQTSLWVVYCYVPLLLL